MTAVPARRYSDEGAEEGASGQLTPLEQAHRIAELAQGKLAEEVVILDMRAVCFYTDYFVICTGKNPRQAKAIYEQVRDRLKAEERIVPEHVEGAPAAGWILADYLDVVLHVFTPEARSYYRLEDLWSDVPSVEVEIAAG